MNVSLSEIVVILLIAVLVIKPEQLPDVAFTLGRFAQSLRRLFSKAKEEMNGLVDSIDKNIPNKNLIDKNLIDNKSNEQQ